MFENNNVGNARGVAVFPFNGMDTWNESLEKFEHTPISNLNASLKASYDIRYIIHGWAYRWSITCPVLSKKITFEKYTGPERLEPMWKSRTKNTSKVQTTEFWIKISHQWPDNFISFRNYEPGTESNKLGPWTEPRCLLKFKNPKKTSYATRSIWA